MLRLINSLSFINHLGFSRTFPSSLCFHLLHFKLQNSFYLLLSGNCLIYCLMSSKFRQQGIKYCQEIVKTAREGWQKFPLKSFCRKSQREEIELIQPVVHSPKAPSIIENNLDVETNEGLKVVIVNNENKATPAISTSV